MNDEPKAAGGFTASERAAMKERADEIRKAARRGGGASSADGEAEVLAKIAEMTDPDRAIAERIHALVKANAPTLSPRLWYGMPAYGQGDKVVCHFQPAQKFKTRYATFAFSDRAKLGGGGMWPVAYALTDVTADAAAAIAALLKVAVG